MLSIYILYECELVLVPGGLAVEAVAAAQPIRHLQ